MRLLTLICLIFLFWVTQAFIARDPWGMYEPEYDDLYEYDYGENPAEVQFNADIKRVGELWIECDYNRYDCYSFNCREDAILAHWYCNMQWLWDIHWLDDDKDGEICEWNEFCKRKVDVFKESTSKKDNSNDFIFRFCGLLFPWIIIWAIMTWNY